LHEEVTNRTVALYVSAGKLTARTLAKALAGASRKIQKGHQNAKTPQGRQPVKKLMNHGVATNAIPLDGNTRLFDRVARKWNVDYSFHKTAPGKYLLLFKSGQADAITHCFSEYTKRVMDKANNKRPSILAQLKHFREQIRSRPREHDRTREATRNDR